MRNLLAVLLLGATACSDATSSARREPWMDTLALAVTRLNTDVAGRYRSISGPSAVLTLNPISFAAESAGIAAIVHRTASISQASAGRMGTSATVQVGAGAPVTGSWDAESYTDAAPWLGQLRVTTRIAVANFNATLFESTWHDRNGYRYLFDPADYGSAIASPWTGQAWNRDTLWLVYAPAPGGFALFVREH